MVNTLLLLKITFTMLSNNSEHFLKMKQKFPVNKYKLIINPILAIALRNFKLSVGRETF